MLGHGLSLPKLALGRSQGTPWWRTPDQLLDGVAPGFVLDIRNQRYALGGSGGRTLADLLAVGNSSAIRRYCDASGAWAVAPANTPRIDLTSGVPELLLEGASTNLFLASDTPATQSIAVTAQAYTLSFEGSRHHRPLGAHRAARRSRRRQRPAQPGVGSPSPRPRGR